LRCRAPHATSAAMVTRKQWRWFFDHPLVEWTMFVIGLLLIACSMVVGPIPGPGGLLFAVPGLILVLKSSMWARRHYVKLKRWERARAPKVFGKRLTPGRWADLALRRRSALRRERLRKERDGRTEEGGSDPAAIGQAPVQPAGAAPIETPPEPVRNEGDLEERGN
jgi:hypothetical protein